jgi:hypothetical protein
VRCSEYLYTKYAWMGEIIKSNYQYSRGHDNIRQPHNNHKVTTCWNNYLKRRSRVDPAAHETARTLPVRPIHPNEKHAHNNEDNNASGNAVPAGNVPTSCLVNIESAEHAAMSDQQRELQQLESAAFKQLYDALRRNPTNADTRESGSIESDEYERYVDAVFNNAHMIQFTCSENDLMGFFVSTTQSARRKCADNINNKSGKASDPSSKNMAGTVNIGNIVEEMTSSKKRKLEESMMGPTSATNEETRATSDQNPERTTGLQQSQSTPITTSQHINSEWTNAAPHTVHDSSNHYG